MILDFDSQKLLGNATYRLDTPAQREFSAKDKKANRIYIETKYGELVKHNFQVRLDAATRNFAAGLAERLDRNNQRASKIAANKCKKKPNVSYVKKLAALRKEKNVLLRVIKDSKDGQDRSASIEYLIRHGAGFVLPDTIEECNKRCNACQKEIRLLEKSHRSHRRHEQQALAQQKEADGDNKGAKEIRNKIVAENTKNMYQKIRSCRGIKKSGLSRLEVPADENERDYKNCVQWVSCDTPKEIETKLIDRSHFHFGQAKGSFPTVPPFSSWIDWEASTYEAELILNGEFTSDDIDELAQDLIRHTMKQTELDSIEAELTIEEYVGKIQSWPEGTSTSPSGFHLSHSKSLVSPHDLDLATEQGKALEFKRKKLLEWQVALLNLAIRNKYSYKRWQTVVNVMIKKEPNNDKIHRLRVIHLYEHDYNLILAIKWRQMIQSANLKGILNPGQYGAVPGKDAITPTIIEELQYEICRASKRPLLHMDYDATACYDRIIMNLGSLVSRAHGQHRSIVFVNASTLKEAKYLVKTQLGVSEESYKHCTVYPVYGSGQGAGNSPGLWCVISSVLFNLYAEKAHGAEFISPDGTLTVRIHMIGFVDDTSGSVNDFRKKQQQTLQHYATLATYDSQRWNDILQLSGGALEDTKCSYHFMAYDFTVSGLPVLKGGTFEPTICIKFNGGQTPSPLKQLSSHTAHKTLGCQKNPAGNQTKSFAETLKNNTTHSKTVARSPFDKVDTWSYYHAVYLTSIVYPLPSGSLNETQCNTLQVQIKKAVLPKLGYNRNTPNAVTYGHSDYAGMELRTIYVESGLASLQSLVTCLRSDGLPHKLALIALSWAQFLSGTSTPILEDVHTPLHHLDPMKWIPSIRSFLSSINGTLEVATTFVDELQRENDCHLMDIPTKQVPFKSIEQKLANACRLFMGVSLLSDITTADGKNIRKEIFHGGQSTVETYKGHIAYQTRPGEEAWTIWRRLLRYLTIGNTTELKISLGRGFKTGEETRRQWRYYINRATDQVFIHKENEYEILEKKQGNVYEFEGAKTIMVPPKAVPADLDLAGADIKLLPYRKEYPKLPESIPATFDTYISGLPKWEQECLENVTFEGDVFDFVNQIVKANETHCTSDGSAPKFTGSFGWSCSLLDGKRIAQNSGPAFGYRTTSFRAEGYGILSFVRLIYRAFEFTGTVLPSNLHIHTDSESNLKQLKKMLEYPFYFPNLTMASDWDVLQAIITTLRSFNNIPKLAHVTGHQDRSVAFENLSLPAQLNVEADALAGSYVYDPNTNPSKVPRITGNTAQLHIAKGTITSRFKPSLRKHASEPAMRKYLCERNKWSNSEFRLIDWATHGICVRKNFKLKRFFVKLLHNWLPVGEQVARYDQDLPAKCPSCAHETEDRDHFLRCPNRRLWQEELLKELRWYFNHNPTREAIKDILLESIRSWFQDAPVILSCFGETYDILIKQQASVGWMQLLLGRFVHEWSLLQEEFLRTITNRPKNSSGTGWVIGVTTIMWKHIRKEWETRNSARHGIDDVTKELARIEQAKREIVSMYELKDEVLPRDRELYYETTEAHFEREKTSLALRQWLSTWKPVLLKSHKTHTQPRHDRWNSIRRHLASEN